MKISFLATTAARRIGLLVMVLPAVLGTADGGVVGFTKIADGSDGLSRFSAPSINGHGVVAFRANLASGDQALFRGAGGPLTEIAREATNRISSPFRDFRIADDGSVVYRQRTSSTNTGGVAIAQLEPPPTAAVPEPASFAVWCLAVLGICSWIRCRPYARASANGAAPVA